jgi:GNAT superfamily N-acetyltransferase
LIYIVILYPNISINPQIEAVFSPQIPFLNPLSFIMRSLSGPRYPPPILVPAVRADIPDMARVYADAERPNLLTRVLWSPEKLAKTLIKELDANFDNPRLLITKALDADTKELTAFGIWQLTGYDSKELSVDQSTLKSPRPSNFKAGLLLSIDQDEPLSPIGQYINSAFEDFLNGWFKGTKFIYLALLMTDPKFQRRGIGSALLKWGHERANRDKVNSALIASPVGHPLYQSLGWKDISTPLEVDFQKWVQYAQNGDMGW